LELNKGWEQYVPVNWTSYDNVSGAPTAFNARECGLRSYPFGADDGDHLRSCHLWVMSPATLTLLDPSHCLRIDCRKLAISATMAFISRRLARTCRTESGPFCRFRPFWATIALPASVLGPVDRSHGLLRKVASRMRWQASKPNGLCFNRSLRPVSTRLGLDPIGDLKFICKYSPAAVQAR
jgi:hypothetical protein